MRFIENGFFPNISHNMSQYRKRSNIANVLHTVQCNVHTSKLASEALHSGSAISL